MRRTAAHPREHAKRHRKHEQPCKPHIRQLRLALQQARAERKENDMKSHG
jgi:hypothetical protein